MSRARLHQIEVCHVLPNVQSPVKTAQRNEKTQRCIQSHKIRSLKIVLLFHMFIVKSKLTT